MDERISGVDKCIILYKAGIKYLRGIFYRPFMKKAVGFFMVGKHVDLSHCKHITCGRNVKFEDYSEIHGLCEKIVLGDNVTIGRGVKIRPSSYYGRDFGQGLVIGNNSSIGPEGYVGCSGEIRIGDNVMIGPKCSFFAENHVFSDTTVTIKSQGVKQKGIVIEDDCWIGSNCIILDGVTIGQGSVIAAGTLVTKSVPRGSIVKDKRNKIICER